MARMSDGKPVAYFQEIRQPQSDSISKTVKMVFATYINLSTVHICMYFCYKYHKRIKFGL